MRNLFFVGLLSVLFVNCDDSNTDDPWEGCPEVRQCLAGDIATNEFKSCCEVGEICQGSQNPEEGGFCGPETVTIDDPWEGCPEVRQCLAGDIASNEFKSCCDEDEVCESLPNPEEGGVCVAN